MIVETNGYFLDREEADKPGV